MSRFDDEGAPLISRSVTDRWNLPVANIQRVLRLQPAILRLRWEAGQRRRPPAPEPEPEPEEPPETYDEHGELLHAPEEKHPSVPHIDLKG